jgi:hypothetical protein
VEPKEVTAEDLSVRRRKWKCKTTVKIEFGVSVECEI